MFERYVIAGFSTSQAELKIWVANHHHNTYLIAETIRIETFVIQLVETDNQWQKVG